MVDHYMFLLRLIAFIG